MLLSAEGYSCSPPVVPNPEQGEASDELCAVSVWKKMWDVSSVGAGEIKVKPSE